MATTTTAPANSTQPRSERRRIGQATVSSASMASITPMACPDGNDVENAETRAVAGRGRSAKPLAISVTSPPSSTLITRNKATRTLRRTSATTISTRVSRRNAVGPSAVQNTSHAVTQAGCAAPIRYVASRAAASTSISQFHCSAWPIHNSAYTATATAAEPISQVLCGVIGPFVPPVTASADIYLRSVW
jgi:hypothetical protein